MILADYRASGLSQVRFCRERGLSVSTLGYWLRRSRADAGPADEARLLPVRVRDAADEQPSVVTIRLPSGLEVVLSAGSAVAEVAALVRQLEATSC